MTSWVRLWHETPTDPKWRVIAKKSGQSIPAVIAVWNFLMVNASENATERGRTHNWNNEDVAAALDLEDTDIQSILDAMQGKVLEGDKLSGWEKRQPKREDSSAERSKEWRERNRTQRDATERPETEQIQNREEKKDIPPTPSRGECKKPGDVSEPVWKDFKALRKAKKAAITETAIHGIRREAEKAGIALEAAMREMCTRGWQGFKAEWMKGNGNETNFGSSPNSGGRAGNKHERAKASLIKSGIELGYLHPPEERRAGQETAHHDPLAVL